MNMPLQDQFDSFAEFIDAKVAYAIGEATLEEKVAMMSGNGFFAAFVEDNHVWGARPYRAGGGCERLGLPMFGFSDGPRGVARGESTCFPVPMARGASFDPDLEYRIGEAMSLELRAQGCNLSGAVCINLLRHPAWGRAQETYSEDSYHLGEMGAALAKGLQVHNVAATVKHFAVNSIENSRFYVDVQISERVLRELYLPHFKRVLDAGCQTVMSAYNKLNSEYCGQHKSLLTDILRNEWGFKGVVHSDWIKGVYAPYGAEAGLDIENPEPIHFGEKLLAAVRNKQISPAVIDRACARIMRVLWSNAYAEDPRDDYSETVVACEAHRALAHEAAQKSAVLLKNQADLLPLAEGTRIAVLGSLADRINTGDEGSSRVRPPYVTTPLAGLRAFFGDARVHFAGEERDAASAVNRIGDADLVVVVTGYTANEEGEFIPGDINLGQELAEIDGLDAVVQGGDEALSSSESVGSGAAARGGDRMHLGLPQSQVSLIKAAAATGKPILVVLQAGSAVLVEEWIDDVAALIQTFYSGMEGGRALAELISGVVNPSGRLPFTVARDASHYPFFDPLIDTIHYDLWHGYGKFQQESLSPRFCFGFGLSYTHFDYRALKLSTTADGDVVAQVSIKNMGSAAGASIAQLYLGFPGAAVPRWPRTLKAFQRVELAPGEQRTIELTVRRESLGYWDESAGGWQIESGLHRIDVGPSSDPADLLSAGVQL